MPQKPKRPTARFTVPEVWRTIVKKNERQGDDTFDVLVCAHAVPANDNTYRRARSCPECRMKVQQYADGLDVTNAVVAKPAVAPEPRAPARRHARATKVPGKRRSPHPVTR